MNLRGLSDPEDFSSETPFLGRLRSCLGYLLCIIEKQKCGSIQGLTNTPLQSTMPNVEMAISYAGAEDDAVGNPCVSTLSFWRQGMWLPCPGAAMAIPRLPDQPPSALGTPATLPLPCSFDHIITELHNFTSSIEERKKPRCARGLSCPERGVSSPDSPMITPGG